MLVQSIWNIFLVIVGTFALAFAPNVIGAEQSPLDGKLVWKGVVKGERLESAVTMLEPGKSSVEHRAWGDLKR